MIVSKTPSPRVFSFSNQYFSNLSHDYATRTCRSTLPLNSLWSNLHSGLHAYRPQDIRPCHSLPPMTPLLKLEKKIKYNSNHFTSTLYIVAKVMCLFLIFSFAAPFLHYRAKKNWKVLSPTFTEYLQISLLGSSHENHAT